MYEGLAALFPATPAWSVTSHIHVLYKLQAADRASVPLIENSDGFEVVCAAAPALDVVRCEAVIVFLGLWLAPDHESSIRRIGMSDKETIIERIRHAFSEKRSK